LISIVKQEIENIPIIHVVKQSLFETKTPCVIFSHGFTSAKEHNLHIAYYLAEKGIRVIMPDAIFHGTREADVDPKTRELMFWDIVTNQIKELNIIKEYLVAHEFIQENKIGLAGTSMGAIITYGALTQYDWINSAVSLMGTAYYTDFANAQLTKLTADPSRLKNVNIDSIHRKINDLLPYDFTEKIAAIPPIPLLIWHGKQDNVVPYSYSEEIYRTLQSNQDWNKYVKFIAEDNVGHQVSRKAIINMVEWLVNQLITKSDNMLTKECSYE
jgi:uncharacterized protein